MNAIFADIAMFGFVPLCIAMFALLPSRRAVTVCFLLGALFLPNYSYKVEGIPDYNKVSATCIGVILGSLIFDGGRLLRYRFSLLDLSMVLFCLSPMITSLLNGLGPYDGLSQILRQMVLWGMPFFIGRLYFTDFRGLRELAVAVFIGGLVYIPLCLFEMRMSPILHMWVYGAPGGSLNQQIRFGGWRPMVFMQHGLAVGFFMGMATMCGLWLWRTGALRRIGAVPMSLLVPVLGITTILCRSLGAMIITMVALLGLYAAKRFRTGAVVVVLVGFTGFYIAARTTTGWSGESLVSATSNISDERAESLGFRFQNESRLIAKAMEQPLFGWGSGNRARVIDDTGKDDAVTDGLWVITLGTFGLVGLAGLYGSFLLPPTLLLLRNLRPRYWAHPTAAGASAMGMLMVVHSVDCLLNGMLNPVWLLAAGGITGFVTLHSPRMVRRMLEESPPAAPRRTVQAGVPGGFVDPGSGVASRVSTQP